MLVSQLCESSQELRKKKKNIEKKLKVHKLLKSFLKFLFDENLIINRFGCFITEASKGSVLDWLSLPSQPLFRSNSITNQHHQPPEGFLLKADPGNSQGATGLPVDSGISRVGNLPGLMYFLSNASLVSKLF